MRRLRWVAPALAAAALVAGGCGGDDDSGGGRAAEATRRATPIKIGASLPLTGEFSEPGKAAQQGYQVWEAMTNEQGGLLDRKVKFTIRDDASDQNTVVADYTSLISRDKVDLLAGTFSSLLNIPASTVAERNKMLYVEPAGGAPEIFDRGYKYLFFAQQATADKQGDVFADWVLSLPEDSGRRRPPTRRSTTRSRSRCSRASARSSRRPASRPCQKSTYPADTSNFDSIANAVKAKNPDVVAARRDVRRRRRLRARAEEGRLHAEDASSRRARRRSATSTSKGVGDGIDRGHLLRGQPHAGGDRRRATRSSSAKYKEMFGGAERARGRGRRVRDGAGHRRRPSRRSAVERERPDEAGRLAARPTRSRRSSARSAGTSRGAPKGEFLIGQWQDGKPEIVLPEEAATSQTIVQKYGGVRSRARRRRHARPASGPGGAR